MRKILLISHFGLAGGMLSTMSYFGIGGDNCTAINAYENDLDPKGELEKFWAGVNDEDQVLIFSYTMNSYTEWWMMPLPERRADAGEGATGWALGSHT